MPKPEKCHLMQSNTRKFPRNMFKKFLCKLNQRYCKVMLTKDLVLCVSNSSEDKINFTVDLQNDDYDYFEPTNTLHLPGQLEDIQFNDITGTFMSAKIGMLQLCSAKLSINKILFIRLHWDQRVNK